MQPQNIRWVWTCAHMNVAMGWLSQQRWMEWANQFMVKPLQKKSQMDTTCVYIYTLPNANFPLKNLCVEPCWAVLFSHHLHVENAHPLLHYNAELLIRKSFWTLPCISWAAHRAINQYPCWHAYVHLATKKNREMIQAYIHGLWKIVHHPYLAICIKHAISLRTGRTPCSIP
jgi:hypothetical protein